MPLVRAGVAEDVADVRVLLRALEEVFGDVLGAERVARQENALGDFALCSCNVWGWHDVYLSFINCEENLSKTDIAVYARYSLHRLKDELQEEQHAKNVGERAEFAPAIREHLHHRVRGETERQSRRDAVRQRDEHDDEKRREPL